MSSPVTIAGGSWSDVIAYIGAMTEDEIFATYADRAVRYARALGYFLPGGDADDLDQEALMGLLRAARSYREGYGNFWGFARMVIVRHLAWILRHYNKQGS